MHVTSTAMYFSSYDGERFKVWSNLTLAWAIYYGSYGKAMGIYPNADYLLAGANVNGYNHLGKL